jgi:hypothetical protein
MRSFDANQVLCPCKKALCFGIMCLSFSKTKGESIRKIIGVDVDQKICVYYRFFNSDGRNKMGPYKETYTQKL